MALRVLFFGNSESVFSNRHVRALFRTHAAVVGVVDAPPHKRSSTNARHVIASESFVDKAHQLGIPAFEPDSPNAPGFVETVRALQPDLFIAVGYTQLLKADLLAIPRLAANFHASLLPAYRGKSPVFWALRNGEPYAGLTVHVMDPNLDTGDILFQVRVRTLKHDSVTSLYDRIMRHSIPLVKRLVTGCSTGRLTRTPQSTVNASYYSSVREQDFALDWARSAELLRRWIQTSPGQCFADIAGQRVYFTDAERIRADPAVRPGTVTTVARTSAVIAAGQDALRLRRLRLHGKEKTAAKIFRELNISPGTVLPSGPGA